MSTLIRYRRTIVSLVVSIAALSLTVGAFAQTTPAPAAPAAPGAKKAHHGENGLMKALNLTADQKKQAKEISTANRASIKAINDNKALTPDQKKTQIKDLRKQTNDKLIAILTPEQKEKFQQLRDQMKAARAKGGKKGAAAPKA